MAKVLVIDDDEGLRNLFREILHVGGHDAQVATSGDDGLRRLHELDYDVVLTDVVMPDKDGLETIRELRRDFPGVRVVAISGGGCIQGVDYLRMAKLLGANATLAKPVRPHQLLGAVASVLAA